MYSAIYEVLQLRHNTANLDNQPHSIAYWYGTYVIYRIHMNCFSPMSCGMNTRENSSILLYLIMKKLFLIY